MAEDVGLSFSPLTNQGGAMGQRPAQTPVQDAIRTLSYRVPKDVGSASPIPPELLAALGGAGIGGVPGTEGDPSMGFEEIIRKIFGMTPGAMTPPRIFPGLRDPGAGGAPIAPAPTEPAPIEPTLRGPGAPMPVPAPGPTEVPVAPWREPAPGTFTPRAPGGPMMGGGASRFPSFGRGR